jgi:hypothetical protein
MMYCQIGTLKPFIGAATSEDPRQAASIEDCSHWAISSIVEPAPGSCQEITGRLFSSILVVVGI